MSLKDMPELHRFLSTYFPDADPDADETTVQTFLATASAEQRRAVIAQAHALVESDRLSVEDLGIETNRWFGDSEEAKAWIRQLAALLENDGDASVGDVVVKDVNGAPLAEGDSVQVIKDLKVKGGSSDLKRGTLIKKIHLIGDPANIECRVDGSTLVLKTCFLKKA
jgi:alkylphosphonate utilization operon protein PhnA